MSPRVPKKNIETVPLGQPVKTDRNLSVIFVLVTLLFLAIAVAGYFYFQYRQTAQVQDAKEIEELSLTLGQFMELPTDEVPTLATVTDKEKLLDQPFFQKSENGDKVLIYSKSGRAILYRPGTKKIIDITTVNVNQPAPAPEAVSPAPQPSPEVSAPTVPSIVRVTLLNGSTTVGITNIKEKELTATYSNIAVVSKETAKKNDYKKSVVVDVTGKNADMAAKVATALGGVVGSLPEGEVASAETDILAIIGQE